jgi:alpha-glucosidase (family GH31 glycosyl hydrolase)
VAGKIPMVPKYAFGYWWSRYWVYSDQELRELMNQFRSFDIPIDVLVIDMDWHETFGGLKDPMNPKMDETGHWLGWTGYTWNKSLFPNPERFLDWTNKNHLKTALNLHPASGIAPMEEHITVLQRPLISIPQAKNTSTTKWPIRNGLKCISTRFFSQWSNKELISGGSIGSSTPKAKLLTDLVIPGG